MLAGDVARTAIGVARQQQRNDGEVACRRRVVQRRAVEGVRDAVVDAVDVDAVVEQQLHLGDVAPAGDDLEEGGGDAPGVVVGIGAVLEQPLRHIRRAVACGATC